MDRKPPAHLPAAGSDAAGPGDDPAAALAIDADVARLLLVAQHRVLQALAKGAPLLEVLEMLCESLEQQSGVGAVATVLMADADGAGLRPAAGRRCPTGYSQALGRVPVGPAAGSCGTAAYRRAPVIVADIDTDPLWADYRALALGHGLASCWSIPLLSSAGVLLGTFAVYHPTPRAPRAPELQALTMLGRTAGLAIDRHRAEAERSQLSEQRQLALDAARLGWWTYDPATGDATYDSRCREIFGLAAPKGPVLEPVNLIHADDRPGMWAAVQAALDPRQERPYAVDYRIVRPDGQLRWIEAHGVATFEGEGGQRRGIRLVGTVADITEQREDRDALAEEARRKDEFLAILGHELRNPLAPMSNALRLVRSGRAGDQQRWLAIMDRQLRQMTRLVDDLLDIQRISTGKLAVKPERTSLRSVVEAAVESSQPQVTDAGHALELVLPAEPIWLHADRSRLAQVFCNLINNAAKYTPRPGRIAIEASLDGPAARVRITDNGIGIAADKLPQMFGLFTQVHGNEARVPLGGLGVGLWLARTVVELHHGQLEAESGGPGQGSTFIVTLPIVQVTV